MNNLLVGVCAYRQVEPETMISMIRLCIELPGWNLMVKQGSYIAIARNEIVSYALEKGAEYILFIDSDMEFAPEDVANLGKAMETHTNVGAISALYYKWKDHTPIVNWKTEEGWSSLKDVLERTEDLVKLGRVEDVDVFGAGMLLVKTEIFKDMEYPYFNIYYDKDLGWIGEDADFCRKVKEAGYRSCIHFGVKVNHIGPHAV